MAMEFAEEERMLIELVEKFVENELMPLEKAVMVREAAGQPVGLLPEEEAPLLKKCQELGLWALDAPEEVGVPLTVDCDAGGPGTAQAHDHSLYIPARFAEPPYADGRGNTRAKAQVHGTLRPGENEILHWHFRA